jgi:hypothetical protein
MNRSSLYVSTDGGGGDEYEGVEGVLHRRNIAGSCAQERAIFQSDGWFFARNSKR